MCAMGGCLDPVGEGDLSLMQTVSNSLENNVQDTEGDAGGKLLDPSQGFRVHNSLRWCVLPVGSERSVLNATADMVVSSYLA